MMHSVIEAIYDTYCTAALQPLLQRDQRTLLRRPLTVRVQEQNPDRQVLAKVRKSIRSILSNFGRALQNGDQMVNNQRAGPA